MIPVSGRKLMRVWWTDCTNVAGGWHDAEDLGIFATNGAWECSNTGWLVYEDDRCYVLAGRMTDDGRNVGLVERIPKAAVTREEVLAAPDAPADAEAGPLEPIPAEPVPGAENASRRHWEYPAGGPGCPGCAPADGEADHCPECHMPLTMHHDPGCSRPCGRCKEKLEAKIAQAARLTVCLPAYMDEGGGVVAPVAGTWAEVFPGLEASLRSVRTGLAEVEFRLAPPDDGQPHD